MLSVSDSTNGKLSEAEKEAAGREGSEHREDEPEGVFLQPGERKYPVKMKRDGDWKYDRDLLLAAAREARMHGHEDLAKRADEIRGREFGSANDMALDRSPENRTKTEDGRLIVKISNISKANVCPYIGEEINGYENLGLDPAKIYQLYRAPDELKKAASTFDKVPLLLIHKPSTAQAHPSEVTIGTIGENTRFVPPYLQASLAIWAGPGVKAVESGRQAELSCGYRYDADMTPGKTPDGTFYDGVMRNIRGNHVALVEDGRAGSDVVVGDSMERINMATKTKLSRMAAAAQGALMVHFLPKLAKDAKLDLGPVLAGVTAKNFKERVPGVKLALDGALKGKLANDAEAGEIVRAAGKLLDLFEPDAAGMDDDPDMADMPSMDSDWSEDDTKALEALTAKKAACDQRAQDEAETEEERKRREGAEAEDEKDDDARGGTKSPVTKEAMDAALAKMAKDNALAVKTAEAATVRRMNDIADAKGLVEPLMGKIPVAMDSAEAVYGAALKHLGIAADGINRAGMKALIEREIAHRANSNRPQPRLAHDAATRSERQSAETALGITTKRARHV